MKEEKSPAKTLYLVKCENKECERAYYTDNLKCCSYCGSTKLTKKLSSK